jgi:hypothetical protein
MKATDNSNLNLSSVKSGEADELFSGIFLCEMPQAQRIS